MNPVTLIIGGLAVWRLSHALVKENGPRMWFARLRARLARTQKRSGGLFDMISCVHCTSFWIGLIAALWVSPTFFHLFGYGLAFSAIAMLLETFFAKQTNPLAVVTPPATDDEVLIRRGPAPKQWNNVVSDPRTTDGSLAVKATTSLDN